MKDPSVKAAFIVNPSNPPSYALTPGLTERIVDIVTNYNPNLMIITDDVYATYVHGFRSLMAELPDNTLCVYSFSKIFPVRQAGVWQSSLCMKITSMTV